MGAQVSSIGRRGVGVAVAAVVLVVAGVVALSGTPASDKPREQAPRGVAEVTASASVAQAYTLRPNSKPHDTCRYPYQVLDTGQRLVWVEDDAPFVAPADVRGVWLLVNRRTNTYMWFVQALTPYAAWEASGHNRAGAWFEVPAREVTWCDSGEPPAHAPR